MNTSDDEEYLETPGMNNSQESGVSVSSCHTVLTTSSNIPTFGNQEQSFYSSQHPRLTSRATSLSTSTEMQWTDHSDCSNSTKICRRQLKRKRDNVGKSLIVQSGCDPVLAKVIIDDIWEM